MITSLQFLALRQAAAGGGRRSVTGPNRATVNMRTWQALSRRGLITWHQNRWFQWPEITQAGTDAIAEYQAALPDMIDRQLKS